MQILLEAGFSEHQAARAYRALFISAFGFSAFGPGKDPEGERAQTREALTALPTAEYPALTRSADQAASAMVDETLFELTLDYLLDGFERQLQSGGQ